MSTQHEVDRLLRENGMHAADIDMELELVKFKADFFAGLSREGKASLMMLPSYIPVTTEIISGKPIIAVDAGGTNL
ncbi:MAG: hypothetical protein RRY38_01125, partial [Oscillospiraceae bacterium]